MKPFLKPLAIAALSIAMLAPAQAKDPNYFSLGLVDFKFVKAPIGCRNLDDAIEASKLDREPKSTAELVYPEGVYPFVAWALRHQAGSKMEQINQYVSQRIPPKGDCRFADKIHDNIFKKTEGNLSTAVKVKWSAPNLPPGKIAVCVTDTYGWVPESLRDCSGTVEPVVSPTGWHVATYWVVVDPDMLWRTFDLPREQ